MDKEKIKVTRNFYIAIFSILIILFAWAGLTKAGYIKNYLGVKILCSGSNSPLPQEVNKQLPEEMMLWKPVIYLYPEKIAKIDVKLDYRGAIAADYPAYNHDTNGWRVLAFPDGKIINEADNKEYSYLFWEGTPSEDIKYDLSSGFVVKGSETRSFLQEKLSAIGLTPKEYNEFIVFWYPRMKDNAYNFIKFAGNEYTDTAPLSIDPKPDSMLRVFMVYKPLDNFISIEPQKIKPFTRKGFTVVEWGGTEIK